MKAIMSWVLLPLSLCLALMLTHEARAESESKSESKEKSADAITDAMLELDPLTYGGAEARVRMVLVNERGQEQERQAVMMSRRDGDVRRTFVRFLAPTDISGTSFLGIDDDGDRVQHIFLPEANRERRISTRQRNARFVGTDYTYADMDNRDIEDSTRTRLPDETMDGSECYVIEAKPTDRRSPHSRIKLWIAKESYLPLKMQYFNRRDVETKRYTVSNTGRIDNRWVIMESRMADLRRNHSTIMRLSEIEFKTDIPMEQFTVRALLRE